MDVAIFSFYFLPVDTRRRFNVDTTSYRRLNNVMCLQGRVCMCVHFTSYYSSLEGGIAQALSSERKINQADSTDWMSFLSSNLLEEISSNLEAFSTRT